MIFKTLLTSAAVSLAVASYAQAAVQDGTFEGTANGKNGPVTVAVTIKAGKITIDDVPERWREQVRAKLSK